MLTITYVQAVTLLIHTQGRFNNHLVCSVYGICHDTMIMEVMKIGNIVPRVRTEHTSLAFWASLLTITSPRLPDVTTLPTPTCLDEALCLRDQSKPLHHNNKYHLQQTFRHLHHTGALYLSFRPALLDQGWSAGAREACHIPLESPLTRLGCMLMGRQQTRLGLVVGIFTSWQHPWSY